jgi:hypothetical protein
MMSERRRSKRGIYEKLWIVFIAIFVFSFAVLGWVGIEIFRQARRFRAKSWTTDGLVLIAAEEISNGQNVWQAMGGWRAARFGDMALTLRPIGRQIICIAKRSSS